jgi:hypothetical protein
MNIRGQDSPTSSFGNEVQVAAATALKPRGGVQNVPIIVYEVQPLRDPRWTSLVDRHPRASVFHSSNWLRALSTVYGYEPVVVTTCPPGVPLTNGLVFCRIKSWLTGRRLVSLPFSDHCEPLVDNADECADLLSLTRRYVDEGQCKYIEIRPLSYEPTSSTRLDGGLKYSFHSLDLRRGTQELFRSFHKDCVQRKIRRAERENLEYEDGHSEDLLQIFYRLMVMTRRRQFLPPQPIEWFRGLLVAFGKDLKIRVASKDGIAVAAILTLSHRRSVVYKYGCSDATFNKFGGMALLFWKTIQDAKDNGYEELDMGRSDTCNQGLIAFKQHWGAVGKCITYWSYPPRKIVPISKWTTNLVRRVVSAAPDVALKAVGRMLYKHIG